VLLLLVTIFPQSFFALVRRHLMSLSLFTAWHNLIFKLLYSNVFGVLSNKKNTPAIKTGVQR
jgi:hypothetical protein